MLTMIVHLLFLLSNIFENLQYKFATHFSCLVKVGSQPMPHATARLGVYLQVPMKTLMALFCIESIQLNCLVSQMPALYAMAGQTRLSNNLV
jgi:hypothetical protein